jgi:hypothetical protein
LITNNLRLARFLPRAFADLARVLLEVLKSFFTLLKKNLAINVVNTYHVFLMTNTNQNLVVSSYGNALAIGVEGSKEEIETQFNRFFNHGAAGRNCTEDFCNEEGCGDNYLHFTSDKFAYFLSTDEAMVGALLNEKLMTLNSRLGELQSVKGKKGGLYNELKAEAEKDYSLLRRENFMGFKSPEANVYQQLDGGAPTWDSSSVSLAESVLI